MSAPESLELVEIKPLQTNANDNSGIRLLIDGIEIAIEKGFDGTTLSEVLNLLPLSTINTIVTECRNAGYITLEPIPGKRRECYLRFTGKGRAFADLILAEIHAAEEKAMQETVARFSSEFVEALEFYAKTFHDTLHLRKDDDEA